MSTPTPSPFHDDQNATHTQLLAAAANDLAAQQAANRAKQEQGGTGQRQGVLHGEGH